MNRLLRSLTDHIGLLAFSVLMLVVTGAIVLWAYADNGSKQADLATATIGGAIIALAIMAIERQLVSREARRDTLSRIGATYDLSGAVLQNEDLKAIQFRNKNLASARLDGSDLRGAAFWDCILDNADLSKVDLRGAEITKCQAKFARFCDADLRGAKLQGSDLSLADLNRADLRDSLLGHVNFHLADLSDAKLSGATFVGRSARSPLLSATLTQSILYGADLTGAVLAARDLDETNTDPIATVDLTGAVANETTRWPHGFDPIKAGVTVLPGNQRRSSRPLTWLDPGYVDMTDALDPTTWKPCDIPHRPRDLPPPTEFGLVEVARAIEQLRQDLARREDILP